MSIQQVTQSINKLHNIIRDEVVEVCENTAIEQLAKVDHEGNDDTIYAIDRISEKRIIEYFENEIAAIAPVILIAEGLGGTGQVVLPHGTKENQAKFRIIMDPIDGTRSLMYQKRSAWILTGVAPNLGDDTNLQDIEYAIQTEIPLVKQHLSDVIFAYRGKGVEAMRFNRLNGEYTSIELSPSKANSIEQGFAMITRFFNGARDVLAKIDDEIIGSILGNAQPGKAQCFEDQYLSTGGQLYELICGHDRFVADLRPQLEAILKERGLPLGLCCHPYDLCTELIARESGVIITDPSGNPVSSKLNVTDSVSWMGYANKKIQNQVESHFKAVMKKYQLL